MIRWNRLFIILIFCVYGTLSKAQNLFDETSVKQFAEYLYQGNQFEFAAQEYERLTFLDPENNFYKLRVIRCYRLAGQLTEAEKYFRIYAADTLCYLGKPAAREFFGLTFARDSIASAQDFLNCNTRLDDSTRYFYQTCIYLLSHNWYQADVLVRQHPELKEPFGAITETALSFPHKSPVLAATMSAILPGSGKVYSGYWKDGIIAFVFVAVNAFQSYRGFSLYGSHHANGWIFGGLALGFYTGNIYGSAKAAIRHNKKSNESIYSRAKEVVGANLR